ncbi:MAG: hypothetical protein HY216_12915 [Candidatus Rokubacteria bacterium]|nr:hypothetical protein [Candidatus Rokubacteria bacterium]
MVAPVALRRLTRNEDGVSLVEVLVALGILFAGLITIIDTFAVGYLDVYSSGGQTVATAYARQQMEILRNQPFTIGPVNQTDFPDADTTRTWTVALLAGTAAPNRQVRITVTVTWRSVSRGVQSVTLETIRGEWG